MPKSNKVTKIFCGKDKIRSIDEKRFTVEMIMSDETLDRYDEIILAEAYRKNLKTFKEHPILLSSHRYGSDLRSQIGEFEKVWIEGKTLVGKARYYVDEGNPEADWGFKLAQKGIAAYSVGFIPIKMETLEWDKWKAEKDKGKKVARRVYQEVELLETSQVLIPANPSALQRTLDDENAEDVEKDVARYYLDNVESMKEFADLEVTESDIADKFLVKSDEEDSDEEEEELDEEEDVEKATTEMLTRGWEETENEIRHRLKEPSLFSKFRYSALKKDKPRVFAIYGKFKSGDKWAVQALRFPKGDGWTMDSAKSWVKSHNVKLLKNMDQDMFIEELSFEIETMYEIVDTLQATSMTIHEELTGIRTTIENNFSSLINSLNSKTIMPNESYVDKLLTNITIEKEEEELPLSPNTDMLKQLKDSIDTLTHAIKS